MNEKYIIFKKTSDTNREYVYQFSRNNIYCDDDIGRAIEFDNKEICELLCNHLKKLKKENYYTLCIKTSYSIIGEKNE